MSDENNKKSKFNIASVLTMMTVLTPAVYLLGYFYEMGVLSAYGISNEYFPRSVQNYFIQAFIFYLDIFPDILGFKYLTHSILIIFGYSLIIGISAIYFVNKEDSIKKGYNNLKNKAFFKWLLLPAYIATYVTSHFALIFVCILLVASPFLGYKIGSESSLKQKALFQELYEKTACDMSKLAKPYSCVFLIDGNKKILHGKLLIWAKTSRQEFLYN